MQGFVTHPVFLQEFRVQFEMILEGARQLDVARTNLATAEQKETKVIINN